MFASRCAYELIPTKNTMQMFSETRKKKGKMTWMSQIHWHTVYSIKRSYMVSESLLERQAGESAEEAFWSLLGRKSGESAGEAIWILQTPPILHLICETNSSPVIYHTSLSHTPNTRYKMDTVICMPFWNLYLCFIYIINHIYANDIIYDTYEDIFVAPTSVIPSMLSKPVSNKSAIYQ